MNIIITGGYGFIGTYLHDQLQCGYNILAARSKKLPVDEIYKRVVCGNLYPIQKADLDIIYHLAAYSRVQGSNVPENNVFENSVVTLKESLELARQTGAKLVFTSTSYCIVDPYANYYAFSKHLGEQLCQFYRDTYGVDIAIVRLFNVYGNGIHGYPEWKLGVVDKFLLDKDLGSGYIINNSGEQRRDYIHVYDVCEALIKIGLSDTNPKDIYEVGTGKLYSVNQIAKMIFGDTPPECKVEVNGEIFESQTFGGIEFTRKLGWNHTTELENYLKNT